MSNINKAIITGALAADPELRWLSDEGDKGIVRLGVIVRHSKKNAEGDYEDVSKIFDVEVFGAFALLVARKLKKFDEVAVEARLDKDEWEKDGEKRSKVKLVANTIDSQGFFRSKDEDNAIEVSSNQGNSSSPTPDPAPATKAAAKSKPPKSDDIPF